MRPVLLAGIEHVVAEAPVVEPERHLFRERRRGYRLLHHVLVREHDVAPHQEARADVVTGKLDVRAAAGLPEELAEIGPEAADDEDASFDAEPDEWEEEVDAP